MSEPQNIGCAAFEAPNILMTMDPPTDITGWTFKLTIRVKETRVVKLASTLNNPVSLTVGTTKFPLSSSQTGTDIGVGDYDYDIWRIDAGLEKQLVWGEFSVRTEQWQ